MVTKVAARKVGKLIKYQKWGDVVMPVGTKNDDPFFYISPIGDISLSQGYTKDCIEFKREIMLEQLNQIIDKERCSFSHFIKKI